MKFIFIVLMMFSSPLFADSDLALRVNVYGGYSSAPVTNNLSDFSNTHSEGYLIGVQFEELYKNQYLVGISYQNSASNMLISNDVYANFGSVFEILEKGLLSFQFDFLFGLSNFEWKDFSGSLESAQINYDGTQFSYGGDVGFRTILSESFELKVLYQSTSLAHRLSFVTKSNGEQGVLTMNNRGAYLLSLGYVFK